MATGAYDANGIWQYGEDDDIALFSDLLNLGMESASDAFTDDRARIAFLEQSVEQASTFVASSAAARDSYWGIPANDTERLALQNKGARTVRTDTGLTEQYFATYNASTNPGGMATAGWYTIRKNEDAVIMRPTGIVAAPGGATVTINAVGTTEFTGASSIILNGVFNSTYQNYIVFISVNSSGSASELRYRYAKTGTANAVSYYEGGYHIATGAGLTPYTSAGAGNTSGLLSFSSGSYAHVMRGYLVIQAPALSEWTTAHGRGSGINAGNSVVISNISDLHGVNDTFDGFNLLATAGTLSGSISVYGYAR